MNGSGQEGNNKDAFGTGPEAIQHAQGPRVLLRMLASSLLVLILPIFASVPLFSDHERFRLLLGFIRSGSLIASLASPAPTRAAIDRGSAVVYPCSDWSRGLSSEETGFLKAAQRKGCRNEKQCEADTSCPVPWALGHHTKSLAFRSSLVLSVTNVIYKEGKPLFMTKSNNSDDSAIRNCFNAADLSWMQAGNVWGFTVAIDGPLPRYFGTAPRNATTELITKRARPKLGRAITRADAERHCGKAAKYWNHLLMVDRWGGSSFYHWLIDAMFPAWTSRAMVALKYKVDMDDVKVAVLTDGGFKIAVQFEDLWEAVFGAVLYVDSKLAGCFRTVHYGLYASIRPTFYMMRNSMTRDEITGNWIRSFRSDLLRRFQLSQNSFDAFAPWLYLENHRMPTWLEETRWWDKAPVSISRQAIAHLSMREQIALVSHAAGIASIEGATFAHQMFMAPSSYLLIIQIARGVCKPERWHSSVSQYIGLAALEWQVCPEGTPDGRVGEPKPTAQIVHRVIRFFKQASARSRKLGNSWVCVLTRVPNETDASQAACEQVQEYSKRTCWDLRR
eukprot:TRINITY_DN27414_c0_g2_i1.p1 TRINITY_DN27414_c0_g2~~TRINITY_DN27414_c0_g2_i1.p1  ORF type:complete len:561 (-),score=63.52 TRINITY_DN27414_c0_g2_i1:81-1763(-)